LLLFSTVIVSNAQDEIIVLPVDENISATANTFSIAHEQYETLHARIVDEHYRGAKMVQEVWISRLEGKARLQTTTYWPSGDVYQESLLVINAGYSYHSNLYGKSVVAPVGFKPEETIFRLGSVSSMLAPTDLTRILQIPETTLQNIGTESIHGREATKLIVREPVLTEMQSPGVNVWVDVETGILLKQEYLARDGSIFSTQTIEFVEFNVSFVDQKDLFYINHSIYDPDYLNSLMPFATPTPDR
jgi:hypothetical protein